VECIGKGKAHRPYEFDVKVAALCIGIDIDAEAVSTTRSI
jgi:hypothetical protein